MKMNKTLLAFAALPLAASADVPAVTSATISQDANRLVTITYTLDSAPAVVTLDVQTNATANAASGDAGWTSIGGVAVANAQGDVWKKVTATSGTITWHPDLSWPDRTIPDGCARAVVTAWALDNTPDFMVVDLTATGLVRYYPGLDYLPGSAPGQEGAITNNADYRTTSLVMRKCMAKDVTWTMGSIPVESQRNATRETPHKVTLTNNYYIGVFPVTQSQFGIVTNYAGKAGNALPRFQTDGAMRPVENFSYNALRCYTIAGSGNLNASQAANTWPNPPSSDSWLGQLRTMTGGEIDFDLPSEAQWEFAARAGNGAGCWGDGSAIQNTSPDGNLDLLGRYLGNNPGGGTTTATFAPDEGGTPVVGSFAPNSWGIFDMQGGVWEWCHDWYEDDITSYNGAVNIDPTNPLSTLGGTTKEVTANRVVRGGVWSMAAQYARPAFRNTGHTGNYREGGIVGFRLCAQAGLK